MAQTAIAGVVNIITKKRFDDFILEGYYQDELDFGSVSASLWQDVGSRPHRSSAVEFSSSWPGWDGTSRITAPAMSAR